MSRHSVMYSFLLCFIYLLVFTCSLNAQEVKSQNITVEGICKGQFCDMYCYSNNEYASFTFKVTEGLIQTHQPFDQMYATPHLAFGCIYNHCCMILKNKEGVHVNFLYGGNGEYLKFEDWPTMWKNSRVPFVPHPFRFPHGLANHDGYLNLVNEKKSNAFQLTQSLLSVAVLLLGIFYAF